MFTKKHIMLISQQYFLHLHVCPTLIVLHQVIFSRSLLLTSRWPESNHDTFVGICLRSTYISWNKKSVNSSPPSATYMSVNKVSIGSGNGLSPVQCQAITCLIVNWTLRNKFQWNFNQIQTFLFIKVHFEISSAKWQAFCPGGDALNYWLNLPAARSDRLRLTDLYHGVDSLVIARTLWRERLNLKMLLTFAQNISISTILLEH